MSQLLVAKATEGAAYDSPHVLAFPAIADRMRPQSVAERARLKYRNQRCPKCSRVTVEPIEADDALLDRRCEAIPGTATVVGFFCNACRHDWPVSHVRLAHCIDE